MLEGTTSGAKLDPVFIDGFSSKFMDLILLYDEKHMWFRPFIALYYKLKKALFMLNFSQRTIDAKILCIDNLNRFLFYDRKCLHELKPHEGNVKIMLSKDFIIIRQPFASGCEYTLIMDFTRNFGRTTGDEVSSCNVFDLQYEDLIGHKGLIGHKVANKLIDLYLEKVVEHFEYRMDKDGFSFYKGY